jgi:small-conductance mechanosensitive channel
VSLQSTVRINSKAIPWLVTFSMLRDFTLQTRSQTTQPVASRDDTLNHLNSVIRWYRDSTTKVEPGQQPGDSIYLSNAVALGKEVVRLAFQSARSQLTLTTAANTAANNSQQDNSTNASQSAQKYQQMENDVSQRIADDQAAIEKLKRPGATRKLAATLQQQQALEGKLALDKSTLDAIQKMKKFVEHTNTGGAGLEGSINELAQSVPEVFSTSATARRATTTAPTSPGTAAANTVVANPLLTPTRTQPPSTGLFGELVFLYGQMEDIHDIDTLLNETANVRKIASDLRQPLRTELLATVKRGQDLAKQPDARKNDYDTLTQQFDQLSAGMLPLSQEILTLDQSRANLLEWKNALSNESATTLRSLFFRVAAIAVALLIVLGISAIWRRLTFRYVHDTRRCRQLLTSRRFAVGFLVSLVVILGFVSEFSSLATFAGFVTAGIAVGLQTVLLSVAAYFFVVGRYGIRVGDRISVAGVTGDVIEVGLVRFYLMELAGTGVDLYSTGRIVVFSNAVLFQATTPLFKQLPGSQYLWHKVVLPLSPQADYELLEKTLQTTVESIHKDDGVALDSRAGAAEMEIQVTPPQPHQNLQFADSGLDLVARYPVDLRRASELDDKITRSLMQAIKADEKLASGIVGTPKIRAAIKG